MRIKFFVLFLLIGGAILGAAFFAEFIGLDNDPGWGRGRVTILVIGILTIAWSVLYLLFTEQILSSLRSVRSRLMGSFAQLQDFFRQYLYTVSVVVIVLLVYLWFASSGSWTSWDSATRHYADLANSFEHGQLHLATRPSSELLNLSNPYDPELRKGLEFPIDYTLYNKQFFLYWGPVPALILILFNPFISAKVGDLILVFGFTSGIFVLQYLFLLILWDRFFRHLDKWLLLLSILVSGLSGPWMYMLVNEPNGRIYEAAITGAQFFLLAGLLVVVRANLNSDLSYSSLAFAGVLWGLSIGTRLILVVPIGIVCLVLANHLWKNNQPSLISFGRRALSLGLPLAFCILCIGWYNWARFGSVLETGFAYSLAHQDMLKHGHELFSPIYIVQNLHNYVFSAPSFIMQFPFVRSIASNENIVPFLFSLPEVYQAQPTTGLLFIAPFTIFAITPVLQFFNRSWQPSAGEGSRSRPFNFVHTVLFSSFFCAIGFMLVFFWAALRYMGDFMPELILLSAIGFWSGHQLLDTKPAIQKLYSVLGIVFAVIGITISILISLSADQYSFSGIQGFC